MVLGLCERFSCLPSQLMGEDAGLLRMVRVQQLGNRPPPEPGGFPAVLGG